MSYGERNFAEGTADTTVDQTYGPSTTKVSDTSLRVTFDLYGMTGTANITSYKVVYQKMLSVLVSDGSPLTVTSGTNPITITGLTTNSLYKITTQVISSLGQGNQRTVYYNLVSSTSSLVTDGGTSTVSPSGTSGLYNQTSEEEDAASEYTVIPGEQITVESFLKMTAPKNKLSYAFKEFESVQLGTYTMDSGTRSYNDGFYSFGTSILFDPTDTYTPQSAGLGFFMNDVRDSGYFILIRTSGTAAAYTTTPVEIFKLKGKNVKRITDSQKGARSTLDTIFAGQTYNIDVKVKISGKKVTITAFVNGFKVEAVDETGSTQQSEIIYPSTTIALLAAEGSSKFDYVYADTITLDQYLQESVNLYYGQFSNKFLNASFGDFLYNSLNEDEDATRKDPAFEEFGTVVREIKKQSVRFSSAPSIPIKWTVGANNLVNLLGQTRNNFRSESLVLNNTSLTTPLSDGQTNQFAIIGTTIGFSGEIEYSTSLASFYSTNEPVIFESRWLQNEKDVKALAEWIKGRVVNKAKIINMEVFGNPLIAPGDIITVNYPYQGFTTSQKIIVVKVSQSFQGGLKTQIAARTL